MMQWLKEKAPGVHRFLTRRDRPYPVVRELLGVVLGLGLLLIVLFAATGQPVKGGYPVVVVTSGSMMHCSNVDARGTGPPNGADCDLARVGGLGFIDPGDLVFVRDIDEADDVTTLAQAKRASYGNEGDVIVYRINGLPGTPIIHRALFWLEVNGDGTYTIDALGLQRVRTLDDPAITNLTNCVLPTKAPPHGITLRPEDSGFITKGDNNNAADQCEQGLGTGPVRTEWVLGKARGELPWIGLIKLFVDDFSNKSANFTNANGSAKGFLALTVLVLVAGPWLYDRVRRRKSAEPGEDEPNDKSP